MCECLHVSVLSSHFQERNLTFSNSVKNHTIVYAIMYKLKWCFFNIFFILILTNSSNGVLTLIRDLLQFNVAGHPVLHKQTDWSFDPDVGIKRSRLYQEVNGVKGERAIERLGLGIDGNDQERLEQQKMRDEGHLGGLDDLQS